jgi:hypothetical protein
MDITIDWKLLIYIYTFKKSMAKVDFKKSMSASIIIKL